MFSDEFKIELRQLLRMRRDVRRFRTIPLPPDAVADLVDAAMLAPSVGLSEPWRFVSVRDPIRREAVCTEFEQQNEIAASGLEGSSQAAYRKLKLAGLREAPEHLAVWVQSDPKKGRGLGRATMPESVEYSVVAAIQNLWLLARAKGIGVGWVSILRPEAITTLLEVPPDWNLVAYLCLGYPEVVDDDTPELERSGWESRNHLESCWVTR